MLDIYNINNLQTSGYKKYQKMIESMIPKDVDTYMKKKQYYIYKIHDDKQQFIFGSNKSVNDKNIVTICNKYNLTFDNKCKLQELTKIEHYFTCEALCKIDEYITKNNSIKNGLNKCYNLILPINEKDKNIDNMIKETIFMHIQNDIMLEKYKDTFKMKANHGYIVHVSNKENSVIFYESKKTVKEKLQYYYSLRKDYSKEQILQIITTTPYDELKITILERDIDDNLLEERYNFYLRQMGVYDIKIEDKDTIKKKASRQYYVYKNIYNAK
jgi:hypothetical protein